MRILSDADRLEIAVDCLDEQGLRAYTAICIRVENTINGRPNPMTLLELAKQYESDVEARIQCIKDDWEQTGQHYAEDCVDDYKAQLGHWNTTLAQIQTTIKENE